MPKVAFVSFRLGGTDGVAVEARKWAWAFRELGWQTQMVAEDDHPDIVIAGLGIGSTSEIDANALDRAVRGADLIVVENLLSLPLNERAWNAVSEVSRGRPAILHHHDLPWQRPQFVDHPPPPDDPAWRHVTINRLSAGELTSRGIEASTLYNSFALDPPLGDRHTPRRHFEIEDNEVLVLQPTRALARKNIGLGLRWAEALGGTFWLMGNAEDGYDTELEALLELASCRVILGPPPGREDFADGHAMPVPAASVRDAYAAADLVALGSSWEGFGNPTIESVAARRPLAVGRYPVALELMDFGFQWFASSDEVGIRGWFEQFSRADAEHNVALARRHFDLTSLPTRLSVVLKSMNLH